MQVQPDFVPVIGFNFVRQNVPDLQRIARLQGLNNASSYRRPDLLQYLQLRNQQLGGILLTPDLTLALLSNSVLQLPNGEEYLLPATGVTLDVLQRICERESCRFLRYFDQEGTGRRGRPTLSVGELESRLSSMRLNRPTVPPAASPAARRVLPTAIPSAPVRLPATTRLPAPARIPPPLPTVFPPPSSYFPPPLPPPPSIPPPPPPQQGPSPQEQENLRRGFAYYRNEFAERLQRLIQEQRQFIQLRITLRASGVPEEEIETSLQRLDPEIVGRQTRYLDYQVAYFAGMRNADEGLMALQHLGAPDSLNILRRAIQNVNFINDGFPIRK